MTVPVTDDSEARYAAIKLGEMLADITRSLTATEIHAMIVARLRRSDYDIRLARVVAGASEFANLWNALVQGLPLPKAAWDTVVLPSLVAFSSPQLLKSRLEFATSQWLIAQRTTEEEMEEESSAAPESPQLDPDAPELFRAPDFLTMPKTENLPVLAIKRRWPRAVVAAALVLLGTATGLWLFSDEPSSSRQPPSLLPIRNGQVQVEPTSSAETGPTPAGMPGPAEVGTESPPSTSVPPPAPSWTGSGTAVPPAAPHSLTVRAVNRNSIALSWSPPSDPGSGSIAYYRVFVDRNDFGWTSSTRASVTGLQPGVTYTFTVVSYNSAGLASAHSEGVKGTTAPAPVPSPTPPAATPTLTISPSPNLMLGDSFTVSGTGMPCAGATPVRVRILLGGQPVAGAQIDAAGTFSAAINVDKTDPLAPTVTVTTTGEPMTLTAGAWNIEVKVASQPACQVTATYQVQVVFQ